MFIERNGIPILLTEEETETIYSQMSWFAFLQRIVGYLAELYKIDVSGREATPARIGLSDAKNAESEKDSEQIKNLERFYDVYGLRFSLFDSLLGISPARMEQSPGPVYQLLSNIGKRVEEELEDSNGGRSEHDVCMEVIAEYEAKLESCHDEIVPIGMFAISSGAIRISEFSEAELNSSGAVFRATRGAWQAAVNMSKHGMEMYPSFLLLKSDSYGIPFEELIDQVLVKSGELVTEASDQIVIENGIIACGDIRYIGNPASVGITPDSGSIAKYISKYRSSVLSYPFATVLPSGIVSASGMGEGAYDVYPIKNDSGEMVACVIDFFCG